MRKNYGYYLVAFFIALLSVSFSVSPASAAYPPTLVLQWGTPEQFNVINDIAVDTSGFVYVADSHRIQKFTSDGVFVATWGVGGSGDGQFKDPHGVAVDSLGLVYVADFGNYRIQKFTSDGTFVSKWGTPGSGNGQFNAPSRIAVDSLGFVYVSDPLNHRIQKFTSDGVFVRKWGVYGSGDGQFQYPNAIAIDSSDYVYVSDVNNNRIQKFTSNGNFVDKWGTPGYGDGQFSNPSGIAVDSSGYVYVVDPGNHRIQKFTSDGTFVSKWADQTSYAIAVDSSDYLYLPAMRKYAPQEHIPPTVVSTNPADGAIDVSTSTSFTVTFSEPMDPNTIYVSLNDGGLTNIQCTVSYSGTQATFTPISNVANNTTYTATVYESAKDVTGNPMGSNITWTFTTEAPSSSGGGGGGCAVLPTRDSDDQSPIGTILLLTLPALVLLTRRMFR
jgi:sugar lactone lactonase YvrE